MPTQFVVYSFAVLTTLNGAGALAPVDKNDLPAGTTGPIQWGMQQCEHIRGKMEHSERYFCQEFKSELSTPLVFRQSGFVAPEPQPAPPTPERKSEVQPAPPKQPSEIESKKEVKEPEQAPKPKRVARKPAHGQPSDPIGSLVAFFTPRDW